MASKTCRAKDPSKCRLHGNPESNLQAQADKAAATGNAGAYLAAREEMDKAKPAEPLRVTLSGGTSYSEKFESAPLWRKKAVVSARQTTKPEALKTVLANGLVETSRDEIPVGSWIITNPGGEEYAISDEKFQKLYEPGEGDGQFKAKGIIRAYQNPTGQPVSIVAPWGEVQYGDEHCWFAAGTDDSLNPTEDCYIIGSNEFADTYGPNK